jgi:uncharacterized protein involved in exopolysaccharide biosynthesis
MNSHNDTIDLQEVAGILRRGWRMIAGGLLLGLLLALLSTMLLPRSYEGTATVLLRSQEAGSSSLLARAGGGSSGGPAPLAGIADLFSMGSGLETEIEILASRTVAQEVIDSLFLQARVVSPRGMDARSIFSEARIDPLVPRTTLRFRRNSDGFTMTGAGAPVAVVPGVPFALGASVLTLRSDVHEDDFRVQLTDLEETVDLVRRRLRVGRAAGEVAEVRFRSGDRVTAAAVPNALIEKYLVRRRTTDRGVNQHRYEFLHVQTDSVRRELAYAERSLREHQQESGVFDPRAQGTAELEQALNLRAELEEREVEARSLAQMLTRTRSGTLSPRELAAYPTFLRNPAINAILDRVSNLETRRTELLDRRTPNDPDVLVIERSIAQSEAQLLSLSTAYLEGLNTQQAQLRRELERYEGIRSALPAHAEISLRRQREVQRLSETLVALETQLVQARLAAITEGGDVRQIDAATAPRKASFPRPAVMVVLGLVGGLLFGSGAALTSGYFGSRVRIPREAELATGVPALALDAPGPLLLDDGSWKSVLVIPVGASSDSFSVAQRLAAAATLQGRNVVLADFRPARSLPVPGKSADEPLTGGEAAFETGRTEVAELSTGFEMFRANGRAEGAGARGTLGDLEARFATVIVALPPLEQAPTPALLAGERPVVLAARSGVTSRSDLRLASTALTRIGIRVAGVVLHSRDDVAPGD